VLMLSAENLTDVVGGTLLLGSGDVMINGLATDSRAVEPGNVFVAFSGENVDGHGYLETAMRSGARAVMITRAEAFDADVEATARKRGACVVLVPDALRAVQDLAASHRARLTCPVIGVTGSTGKTTTKDFLTAVLGMRFNVISTLGNQNNELGVPLTVLRAGPGTDVLVVEMAMRGLGQIARLCEIAKPTRGLITNVGTSHIELLGSQEAVARAKAELLQALPTDGFAFVNADDSFSELQGLLSSAPVVTYGMSAEADVRAEGVEIDSMSLATFDLIAAEGSSSVTLGVPGRHNVYNALAAAAVGLSLDIALDDVVEGLASGRSSAMRMQVFQSATGVTVINDAYNANPTSMRAALETLAEMGTTGKRVAVLGDMAELGTLTELAHFQMGERVARMPIDVLVSVGPRARHIADGARAAGMEPDLVRPCVTVEEASEVLDDLLTSGDVVLVKASRVMGLERVVEGIINPHV